MEDIKFSVLVPVYNAEKYLDECIKSVLGQTYQNFELILVNDGSTDASGAICDKYALENTRIKVIHKENQGLVLARRDAIKMSAGDFLMFLDSDDCYRKDALELVSDTIKQNDCDMVFFNMSRKECFSTKEKNYGFVDKQIFEGQSKDLIYEKIITTSEMNNLCFKAVKRTIVDVDNDYKEFAFVTSAEDLLQSLPIIDKCKKAVYMDEALYFYRQHGASMVHNFSKKSFLSVQAVYAVLLSYIKKWEKEELINRRNGLNVTTVLSYALTTVYNRDMSKEEKRKELLELSKNDFFVDAMENLDKKAIRRKDLFFANLLYKEKIKMFSRLISLRGKISNILHRVK